MAQMSPGGWWKFWNDPHRLQRESLHQRMRKSYAVPGHIGDSRPHDPFGYRFGRWEKLPSKAHALFWRTHPDRKP